MVTGSQREASECHARGLHVGAAVVTVEPRFGHQHANLEISHRFYLTTGAARAHEGDVSAAGRLESLRVEALPQIPASHAAVRFPALRNFLHLLGTRQFDFL